MEMEAIMERADDDNFTKPILNVRNNHNQRTHLSLYQSLMRLPFQYREVLVLRDISGLDLNDIAIMLGVTNAKAEQLIKEARIALCHQDENDLYLDDMDSDPITI